MEQYSARALHKSPTLKEIGGVSALKKFRRGAWVRDEGGEMHRVPMPRRARAFLLAKICSERGKPESAKRMARIAAREYLFHERESVGTGDTCNSSSYALAKRAADLGGLEKKEFEAIAQEGMDRHVAAGSLVYAMMLGIKANLQLRITRIAERIAWVLDNRGEGEAADRIRYTYLQRLPTQDNVRKASMRRIDDIRREFGEEGRARFNAAIMAKVHSFRGEHEKAEEQAKIAGLGLDEVVEGAQEIRNGIGPFSGGSGQKQGC